MKKIVISFCAGCGIGGIFARPQEKTQCGNKRGGLSGKARPA